MKFGTSIHCMDGRIQEPIIKHIKENYDIEYVDTITEAGPCGILSKSQKNQFPVTVKKRIEISIHNHGSDTIFVAGHYDCAGNPVDKETHLKHIDKSAEYIEHHYPEMKVVKLYVNNKWQVEELN